MLLQILHLFKGASFGDAMWRQTSFKGLKGETVVEGGGHVFCLIEVMDNADEVELLGMAFVVEEVAEVVGVDEAFAEEIHVLEKFICVEERMITQQLFLHFKS